MLPKIACFAAIRRELHRQARCVFARFRRVLGEHELTSAIDFGIVKALRTYDAGRGRFAPYAWLYVKSEVRELVARELRWQRLVEPADDVIDERESAANVELEAMRAELVEVLGEATYALWIERAACGESWSTLAKRFEQPPRTLRMRVASAVRAIGRRYGRAALAERRGPVRQGRKR